MANPSESKRTALTALRWLIEAGADDAVGERPGNRYMLSSEPHVQPTPAPLGLNSPTAVQATRASAGLHQSSYLASPEQALHSARQIAVAAQDVAGLRTAVESFDGCALRATATSTVFADGNPEARIMIIGEAPGPEEDRQGLPFVGPSGRLLDDMLAQIGLDRTRVYITNVLFWRPPGNRTPTPSEVAICLPIVERHIALVAPDYLMLVGGSSAKTLLARNEGVLRLRGRWFPYQNPDLPRSLPALVTLHPAYLLRQPAQKRLAWRDLLAFGKAIERGTDPSLPD